MTDQEAKNFTQKQRNCFLLLSIVIFAIQLFIQILVKPSKENDSAMAFLPAMIGLAVTLSVSSLHLKYDYEPSIPYGIFLAVIDVIVVGISCGFISGFWSFLLFAVYITLSYLTELLFFQEHSSKTIHYGVMIIFFLLALLFGILFCVFEYVMCAICLIILILGFITRKSATDFILIIFIKS